MTPTSAERKSSIDQTAFQHDLLSLKTSKGNIQQQTVIAPQEFQQLYAYNYNVLSARQNLKVEFNSSKEKLHGVCTQFAIL